MKKITQLEKDELIEALNHLDSLADIGSEQGDEKSDQMKSYNFLYQFIIGVEVYKKEKKEE